MKGDERRFKYNREAFGRSLARLREGLDELRSQGLTELGREGLVQSFRRSFWRVCRVLEDQLSGGSSWGGTAQKIVRQAWAAGLLELADGEAWAEIAADDSARWRDYRPESCEDLVRKIQTRYAPMLEGLRELPAEAQEPLITESDGHGLDERALAILQRVLAPYAEEIDGVDLCGARVQGRYREVAEIELVLRGALDDLQPWHLYSDFRDSCLPHEVKLVRPGSKRERDAQGAVRPLFRKSDLLAAAILYPEGPASCRYRSRHGIGGGYPPWEERYSEYGAALAGLREALAEVQARGATAMRLEGAIKRFTYCFRLAMALAQHHMYRLGYDGEDQDEKIMQFGSLLGILVPVEGWQKAWTAQNRAGGIQGRTDAEEEVREIGAVYLGLLEALRDALPERKVEAAEGVWPVY